MAFALGVDGGGSKTVALIEDVSGKIVARGVSGGSNRQANGADAMFIALRAAIDAACAEAGITREAITTACLGLAGADRFDDRALLGQWIAQTLPAARARFVNDAALLLAAGTPEGWGLALVSGTGSIALGATRSGATARAGGWGPLFGDEGSGYAIGVAAMRAVAHAYDTRGPATALSAAILAHWSLTTIDGLIERVYRRPATRAEIAALAQLVDAAADDGDMVADDILRDAADALALASVAVIRALAISEPPPCALAGGVLLNSRRLRHHFNAAAGRLGLALGPQALVQEPARGALLLARTL
jgi:N-acetylglucosamine kinase-like BadF-type ATPase